MLFPFARAIVSDATQNGGFPPLRIDPIDFAQMFQRRMAEEAAAPEGSPSKKPAETHSRLGCPPGRIRVGAALPAGGASRWGRRARPRSRKGSARTPATPLANCFAGMDRERSEP